ncbi:hypothetical protein ACJX0J_032495, partial [Zea mays]
LKKVFFCNHMLTAASTEQEGEFPFFPWHAVSILLGILLAILYLFGEKNLQHIYDSLLTEEAHYDYVLFMVFGFLKGFQGMIDSLAYY